MSLAWSGTPPEPHTCIDCGREIDATPTKQCAECRAKDAYWEDLLTARIEES